MEPWVGFVELDILPWVCPVWFAESLWVWFAVAICIAWLRGHEKNSYGEVSLVHWRPMPHQKDPLAHANRLANFVNSEQYARPPHIDPVGQEGSVQAPR